MKKGKHRKAQASGKPHFASRTLLAAAGMLTVAFGIAADHSAAAEQQQKWTHKDPMFYSFGDEHQQPKKVSPSRLLVQAWSAVQETLPGDVGYIGAQAPDIDKSLTFLDYAMIDSRRYGVKHEKKYAVTVQCKNFNGLACNVVNAVEIEAKDYRKLEGAALDAARALVPGHDLQLPFTDPARQVVLFQDMTSDHPQMIKVKCTNALNYSCTATAVPRQVRLPVEHPLILR